jgi:ABC-2 type transport system permease protein
MRKVWVIVRKEWSEVFKNRFVLFTVAFLPLIFTALPLIMLGSIGSIASSQGLTSADLPAEFSNLCTGISEAECGEYFLLSQFLLMFMMLPLAIPVTFASYSIVGEKTTRTLEPVLATPISTTELLLGKSLAAMIPAIAATWLSFSIFVIGTFFLASGPGVVSRILDPEWLLAILVIGPLLAAAAVSVAVIVSSRANDPRVAEQLSMLVILPLLGLFFGQIAGLFYINQQIVLYMAAGMIVIDAVLLFFATQLFERETILTRWK